MPRDCNCSAVTQHDGLPIGGVADITGRGTPDRLLVSELAAPSLLLAARIAHGGALYRRREQSPGERATVRPILIEHSIRTWGRTRVVIHAAALAIVIREGRRPGVGLDCQTWSADGDELRSELLQTDVGLCESLGRLSIAEHPAAALTRWRQTLDRLPAAAAEPVLIVADDSATDPRLVEAIERWGGPLWVIRAGADGNCQLWRHHGVAADRRGRFGIKLQPAVRPPTGPLLNSADLPLILRETHSPFRWPVRLQGAEPLATADAMYLITRDRRLLSFDSDQKDAKELTSVLPIGTLLGWTRHPRGADLLIGSEAIHLVQIRGNDAFFQPIDIKPHGKLRVEFDDRLAWISHWRCRSKPMM